MILLAGWFGGVADRHGPRLLLTAGPTLVGVSILMLIPISDRERLLDTIGIASMLLFAFGLAMLVAPITATALKSAPAAQAGIASGVNSTVSRLGNLLAVALIGLVIALVFDGAGRRIRRRAARTRPDRPGAPRRLARRVPRGNGLRGCARVRGRGRGGDRDLGPGGPRRGHCTGASRKVSAPARSRHRATASLVSRRTRRGSRAGSSGRRSCPARRGGRPGRRVPRGRPPGREPPPRVRLRRHGRRSSHPRRAGPRRATRGRRRRPVRRARRRSSGRAGARRAGRTARRAGR